MSFDAKSGILQAINEANDPAMKTVLLLMLAVFEEIGGKIDSVLKNERALRETVLNGYTDAHHGHHEWLDKRIKRDDKIDQVVDWVETKMVNEREMKEDARKVKADVLGKVIVALVISGASFAAGWVFQR